MPKDADDAFYARADAHIHLANDQLKEATAGTVSASLMFGASRFNAWRSATGFSTKEEMLAAREETLAYFVAEYEKCLIENLDDYIENFESYMKPNH
jgi:hypothetical protein